MDYNRFEAILIDEEHPIRLEIIKRDWIRYKTIWTDPERLEKIPKYIKDRFKEMVRTDQIRLNAA